MFKVSSDINDFITGLVKMFANNVVDLCFSMNIKKGMIPDRIYLMKVFKKNIIQSQITEKVMVKSVHCSLLSKSICDGTLIKPTQNIF